MKDLYIVTSGSLGKIISSLCNSPMDLLTLLVMCFKCSPNFNLSSKTHQGVFDMASGLPGYC